ncbi:Tigger transposable element-derived protein 1-like 201 [Homarus americanus]|uniref:Tigger transposable element-derived protein 1-like 201 n=1 Tax=Homarus americanus TaxID=6706 RepID=A0A8J5NA69_HOMAM|nr:Tigger transposable element-derived protein 1-like 201 [Homarus americanus]
MGTWKEVTVRCLCAAWRPLWPECVLQRDFEGFEELEEEAVVHEIVSLGNSMGLEVDDDDVEELVEEHSKELSTEELLELHKEENETLKQSLTSEESGEEEDKDESRIIPAKDLKDVFFCWSKLSKLAEDFHPDVGSVQKLDLFDNQNFHAAAAAAAAAIYLIHQENIDDYHDLDGLLQSLLAYSHGLEFLDDSYPSSLALYQALGPVEPGVPHAVVVKQYLHQWSQEEDRHSLCIAGHDHKGVVDDQGNLEENHLGNYHAPSVQNPEIVTTMQHWHQSVNQGFQEVTWKDLEELMQEGNTNDVEDLLEDEEGGESGDAGEIEQRKVTAQKLSLLLGVCTSLQEMMQDIEIDSGEMEQMIAFVKSISRKYQKQYNERVNARQQSLITRFLSQRQPAEEDQQREVEVEEDIDDIGEMPEDFDFAGFDEVLVEVVKQSIPGAYIKNKIMTTKKPFTYLLCGLKLGPGPYCGEDSAGELPPPSLGNSR